MFFPVSLKYEKINFDDEAFLRNRENWLETTLFAKHYCVLI